MSGAHRGARLRHTCNQQKGKVLGSSICKGVDELHELIVDEVGGYIDTELNERLLGILSTKENVNLETLGFGEDTRMYKAIITPIDIAGERLGTLLSTEVTESMTLTISFLQSMARQWLGLR